MNKTYAIIGGLFLSLTINAHRYVCNGILASGEERTDSCGVCDDEHAARWANPNIPVVVDDTPLPAGITKDDWAGVVNNSLKAWNDISGSSLRFVQIEGQNRRDFGNDETLHEIFWIKDKEEWRRLVGVGEFGTLGATLPRYSCGGSLGAKRRIFDADLVLNGMPHINWQVKCEDDDCISIQTTLVHELGHFFGLDHPCLMCSSSIMSARAGFDLMNPVEDDVSGLRILYPQVQSGGFASPCATTSECLEGFECVNNQGNHYCSSKCESDKDCDPSAICQDNAGKKLCALIGEASEDGRDLGENCSRIPCEDSLMCIGAKEEEYFCVLPCQKNSDCLTGESCVTLQDNSQVCVQLRKNGESCAMETLCDHDSLCVGHDNGKSFCRQPCGSDDFAAVCPRGEYCSILKSGESVCLPFDENLSLDERSSGFNAAPGKPGFERDGKKAKNTMGCSGVNINNMQNMPLIWLALVFGLGRLKRRIMRSTI